MTPRVKFIEHQEHPVLYIDMENADVNDMFEVAKQTKEIVRSQPKKSILTLSNVKDCQWNDEVLKALKELVKNDKPYVKAAAVVGANGLRKLILYSLIRFSNRKFFSLDNLDKAKDWLIKQK